MALVPRHAAFVVPVVLLLVLSGCSSQRAAPAQPLLLAGRVLEEPKPSLFGVSEPADFAPTVLVTNPIASFVPSFVATQPVNPVLAALPDGRLLAGTPLCDKPEPFGPDFANQTEQDECQHRTLYLSDGDGAGWERLNQDPRGRLDRRAERPYGHIDVAADGNGSLFALMGDAGYNDVFVYRSRDAGATWNMTLSSVEPRATRDLGPVVRDGRIVAAGLDRLVVGWRGCEQSNTSCWIGIKVSFRGGSSWSQPARFGDHVRAFGPFVVGPTGYDVHVAYLEGNADDTNARLHVLSSSNWGITWKDEDLGIVVSPTSVSEAREARYGPPVVAALGEGGLAVAWTAETMTLSHVVRYSVRLPGEGWTDAFDVPSPGTSRFPSIVAGAGDRFAVVYLAGTAPAGDTAAQEWDAGVVQVDRDGGKFRTAASYLHRAIHVGGFCEGTTECLAGNPRLWLDSFEAVARADGSIAFVYPDVTGPTLELRAAIQTGGSPLFVPAAS